MLGRANAAGGKTQLPRICFGIGDEFRNSLHRNRRMHLENVGNAEHSANWREVADKIEVKIAVERGVDRVRGGAPQKRVAVRWLTRNQLGCKIAGGTRTVI